jgi:hypothetical protein
MRGPWDAFRGVVCTPRREVDSETCYDCCQQQHDSQRGQEHPVLKAEREPFVAIRCWSVAVMRAVARYAVRLLVRANQRGCKTTRIKHSPLDVCITVTAVTGSWKVELSLYRAVDARML